MIKELKTLLYVNVENIAKEKIVFENDDGSVRVIVNTNSELFGNACIIDTYELTLRKFNKFGIGVGKEKIAAEV